MNDEFELITSRGNFGTTFNPPTESKLDILYIYLVHDKKEEDEFYHVDDISGFASGRTYAMFDHPGYNEKILKLLYNPIFNAMEDCKYAVVADCCYPNFN
jgi:hypothetical protein